MSIDRVKALFTTSVRRRKRPVELSPSVVRHDRLDAGVLNELREDARHFDPAFETPTVPTPDYSEYDPNEEGEVPMREEPYRGWEDLLSDVFYGYHTYSHPGIRPANEVKLSRQLHRRIAEQVIHSDGFEESRKHTRLDGIGSALSTMTIADAVRELLEGELQEQAKRAQEMAQQEERIDKSNDANDGIREQVQQQGGQPTPEQRQEMKENAQARSQAQKKLDQLAHEQAQDPMGLDAAEAIDKATDDAKDDAEAVSNLPGSQTGDMKQIPPDEALELARKISENENVREVLKRLGRFERDMRYQRTNRVVGGREEIVDVELGNDLTRLLPGELLKLKHPLLKLDFYRRFYERGLLQYEMIGTAEAGNGPISAALDVSGSMAGEKDWFARANVLAMLSIAHRERRDFVVTEFDTLAKEPIIFPGKQKIDPAKVIEFAGRGAHGGGTDITKGMAKAADIIYTVPEFNKADLVILTDGSDNLGDDDRKLRDELKAYGVRLHGVAVGMASNDWLEEICDTQVSAHDMANPSEATKHIAQVLS